MKDLASYDYEGLKVSLGIPTVVDDGDHHNLANLFIGMWQIKVTGDDAKKAVGYARLLRNQLKRQFKGGKDMGLRLEEKAEFDYDPEMHSVQFDINTPDVMAERLVSSPALLRQYNDFMQQQFEAAAFVMAGVNRRTKIVSGGTQEQNLT